MKAVAGTESSSGSVLDQVGDFIIHHISNSDIHHPIIHLPTIFDIDFSVTKHVLMLWVTAIIVGAIVILPVRSYLRKDGNTPTGLANALEAIVAFIRDSVVKPNVGSKAVDTWAPLILTFLFFIFFANAIGMVPIFDLLGVINRFILHVPADDSQNFINGLLHGGPTATGNFNVTAALAIITFFSIIIA